MTVPPPRRDPASAPPPGDTALALVGRHTEISLLEGEIDRACRGELRVVLIRGGPGIGKSRLVHEAAQRRSGTMHVLSARSYRLGATASFGPWIEAFDRFLHARDRGEVGHVVGPLSSQLAPYLSVLPPGDGNGASQRGRVLEAMTDLLRTLTDDAPLLVCLDDVHLADFSSWEALRYVSRRLTTRPLCILLTARPAELESKAIASEILIGLEDDGLLRRLDLAPLQPTHISELATALLGSAPGSVPAPLISWLVERSLGHPLFAIGLLRALLEEGADLEEPHLDRIPESLRERVAMELRALPSTDRTLLELLSVVDQTTAADELASILAIPLEEVTDSLQRLLGSALLVERPHGARAGYELAHPLIQEAVYQSMIAARRQSLHRSVARALHSAGRIASAAAHFARGSFVGDSESVAVLCEAMRQAEDRGLYQEALAVLHALLEILPQGDARWNQVFDAMRWQADWVVGHLAEADAEVAVEAMRRMQAAMSDSPDLRRRGNVMLHLASFLSIGAAELEQPERAAQAAIQLFEQAGDRESSLLARDEQGWIAGCAGDLERQAAVAGEALAAARPEERRARVQAAGTAGYALGLLGRIEEAKDLLYTSIRQAEEWSLPYRASWGGCSSATCWRCRGISKRRPSWWKRRWRTTGRVPPTPWRWNDWPSADGCRAAWKRRRRRCKPPSPVERWPAVCGGPGRRLSSPGCRLNAMSRGVPAATWSWPPTPTTAGTFSLGECGGRGRKAWWRGTAGATGRHGACCIRPATGCRSWVRGVSRRWCTSTPCSWRRTWARSRTFSGCRRGWRRWPPPPPLPSPGGLPGWDGRSPFGCRDGTPRPPLPLGSRRPTWSRPATASITP